MPIQFTCPHCGKATNVADEYAGQTGPCAGCGESITVPALGAEAGAAGCKTAVIVVLGVLGTLVVLAGIAAALFFPAVSVSHNTARRMQCTNNLKQIGLALHNYHAAHKCFPPAYIPDAEGKPMHSWRVLILPYLEEQNLYDQYNFDEPWDSPANQAALNYPPQPFLCPNNTSSNWQQTGYMMIVGPDTISDGPGAVTMDDITDGTSNTIMVVEVAGSGVPWAEPRDLNAEDISFVLNDPDGLQIRSRHDGVVNVLFCDGSVHALSESTEPELIRSMSTIAGDEVVPPY